ncbi:MAG: mechanosensitive ion channel family protein [Bacteroidota bacterium]
MEQFINDIWSNLQTYYDSIVALLPKILIATLVFSILFFLANQGKSFVTKRLSSRMDDPLLAKFLGRIVKTLGVVIALMIVLKILGLGDIAAGIFAGASFSAVVIGFAFKDIGENFLAGIILAFNRPFRVGDTVELDDVQGVVVTLNIRNTQIKTFDGKDVYIPNANVIKNPVVNYTIDGFLRQEFVVGLDYGSNVNHAMELILKELDQIDGILRETKKPNVFISDLNTSTLDLKVQYWLDTFDKKYSGLTLKTQAINRVLSTLDDAGFYLPGNVLELKNYNKDKIRMGDSSKEMKRA